MNDTDLHPGRYGSMNLLPAAEHINATDEELAWPIVKPVQRGHSNVFLGPHDVGNPVVEEANWPVVPTGEVISLVEQPLAVTAEKSRDCESPPLHQIVRKTG